MAKDLDKHLSNDKIKAKFHKFKSILNELQQTTKWVWMFRWRRGMVIFMNILSICACYFLYIAKNRNLEKFNCPIPPEYYYSIELDDGQRIEVKTETFYYSSFQLRQGLIMVIIFTQSILIVGSILLWKFVGLSEKS